MATDTVRNLIDRGITISVMESCTGGAVASRITDTEGASAVFAGSMVTYSNASKVMAGVPSDVIERHGVYSGETAAAMARAAGKIYGSHISVGVTGTFGNPDPANPEGVCGIVYYCIAFGDDIISDKLSFDARSMDRRSAKEYVVDRIFEAIDGVI